MYKTKTVFLAVLIGTAVASYGQTRQTRDVSGFTSISHSISGNLEIKKGNTFNVMLEGSQSEIDHIVTEVRDGRLQIKPDSWRYSFREKVNVYVTMPGIDGILLSGSGKATVDGSLEAEDMDLVVSGSGRITIGQMKAGNTDCTISGSGSIAITSGNIENCDVTISGSGNMACEDVTIDMMDVTISGSGSCTASVTGSIDARISGSGSIYYRGNPSIDARVSGSGRVRELR